MNEEETYLMGKKADKILRHLAGIETAHGAGMRTEEHQLCIELVQK
jgi:hypothetical protein